MKKFLVYLFLCAIYNGSIFSQTLIADLYPGMNSSEPMLENAEQIGSELYFTASEAGSGICLYKTNGTDITRIEGDPNTFQVYSILGSLGGELYYFELYLDYCKLYKTSGGVGEAQLLYDFNVNSLVIPLKISTVVDDVMYFYGCEGNTGYELWRTDGTTSGTYLVKDIYPGTSSSLLFSTAENHPYFAHLNGIIYFGAVDGVNGSELWRSDGTEAGTYMLKNIDTVSYEIEVFGSNPSYFIKFNDAIYFSAYRSLDGRELWKTDGTEAGTVLVKDISPADSYPRDVATYNGYLYFVADHPTHGSTVFKSDGTTAGTTVLKTPDSGGPSSPHKLYTFKNKLFFVTSSNLWSSDGTAAGTIQYPAISGMSTIYGKMHPTTNYLYLKVYDGDTSFFIYRTNGQTNGMERISNPGFEYLYDGSFYLVNNCLILSADNGSAGFEPYKICNQNSQPLGIESTSDLFVEVFPNPCVDRMQVNLSVDCAELEFVQILDVSGVESKVNYQIENFNSISLTGLDRFSSGIYFLTLATKQGHKILQKFVIQ